MDILREVEAGAIFHRYFSINVSIVCWEACRHVDTSVLDGEKGKQHLHGELLLIMAQMDVVFFDSDEMPSSEI